MPERAELAERDLIARLASELEGMNERHGCGQIECSIAMNAVADARTFLGLRRREPFPTASRHDESEPAVPSQPNEAVPDSLGPTDE